jgi:ribosomal protein L32
MMPEFYVSRIVTPDDDPNYNKMRAQYAEQYLNVRQEQIKKFTAEASRERQIVEQQTAAQMKVIEAQGNAESVKIIAAADAEAYRLQAEAEAKEMQMKGYTYTQETARQVGTEAVKGGLSGGGEGSGGGLGGIVGLGVTLGAIGGVIGMTKDAMNPIIASSSALGQNVGGTISGVMGSWDCACSQKGLTGNFCPVCGMKRPEAVSWDCPVCGQKANTLNFCSNCGAKRPDTSEPWDCPNCGRRSITGNFCDNCGTRREV